MAAGGVSATGVSFIDDMNGSINCVNLIGSSFKLWQQSFLKLGKLRGTIL